MYIKKRIGPNIGPCGTTNVMSVDNLRNYFDVLLSVSLGNHKKIVELS